MDILISQSSNEPIYAQIIRQLKKQILSGDLAPGQVLPSIRQLAKDLQISVITTKRAYEELEKERLIESVVGKGSFVSGANQEFIREHRMRLLEEKLTEIVRESRELGMTWDDLSGHLRYLYEEDEQ